jgi:hypothetical protein
MYGQLFFVTLLKWIMIKSLSPRLYRLIGGAKDTIKQQTPRQARLLKIFRSKKCEPQLSHLDELIPSPD